jgi:hypothetical protein
MTLAERLKTQLVNNGIFPDMADKIVEATKADKANEAMAGRWDEDESGYPVNFDKMAFQAARKHALRIIDTESPGHWARAVFAPSCTYPRMSEHEKIAGKFVVLFREGGECHAKVLRFEDRRIHFEVLSGKDKGNRYASMYDKDQGTRVWETYEALVADKDAGL